jgi:hypothetical protein
LEIAFTTLVTSSSLSTPTASSFLPNLLLRESFQIRPMKATFWMTLRREGIGVGQMRVWRKKRETFFFSEYLIIREG